MTDEAEDPRRLGLAVLGLVVAGIAVRLWLAGHFYGFLSGDDLEVVEGAAKFALGLEYQPWSLRCLFHPVVLVGPVLRAVDVSGAASDPLAVAFWASLPTILASSATIWLTFRLGPRLGLSLRESFLAAFFYAIHWLPLGYGSTQFPRPISTMFFVLALLLASSSRGALVSAGGLLVGAAFAVRFSEGVLALPFLAVVWWRHRSWSALALAMSGGLVGAVLFVGVTDWLTWGRPFASLSEYFRIMSGDARPPSPRSDKPWFWYGTSILQWAGPVSVVLAASAIAFRRAARRPLLLLTMIVLGYSLFAYKAYRYMQAAVPLLALLMGLGAAHLLSSRSRVSRAAGWILLALAPLWGIERTRTLMHEKSRSAVDAGLWMKTLAPRRVLLEQQWAYGGSLTFGNGVEIRDQTPMRPLGLDGAELAGVDAAAFYERDLGDSDREVLGTAGFRPVFRVEGRPKTVVVFAGSP
ncbi:MAG: hypothetical protein ABW056_00090 [Thermoanaerobaculia bacterium]